MIRRVKVCAPTLLERSFKAPFSFVFRRWRGLWRAEGRTRKNRPERRFKSVFEGSKFEAENSLKVPFEVAFAVPTEESAYFTVFIPNCSYTVDNEGFFSKGFFHGIEANVNKREVMGELRLFKALNCLAEFGNWGGIKALERGGGMGGVWHRSEESGRVGVELRCPTHKTVARKNPNERK